MRSTGISYLDKLTGGYKLGDNIVWQLSRGVPVEYFIKSFSEGGAESKDIVIFISFNVSPNTICKRYDFLFKKGNTVLVDAFTHGKGNSDPVFLEFYQDGESHGAREMHCIEDPRDMKSFIKVLNEIEKKYTSGSMYIFDSLTGMKELWKDEMAVLDFFTFTCPKLYDLKTLAYWTFEKNAHSKEFIANLVHITQVVFSLDASSSGLFELKVDKLEGRPSLRDSEAHPFRVVDDAVVFEDKKFSEQFRIGERVKDLRKKMKMTQTELASLLALTSGAVSQIENDITVPSLQTLLNLSHVFKQPVDYFLGNDEGTATVPGYILCGQGFRITSPTRDVSTRQLTDGLPAPMAVYSVSIKGNKTVQGALLMHKGGEFITVTRGTLSLTVSGERITLKEGESLLLQTAFVDEWRNDSGEPAEFLYLLV